MMKKAPLSSLFFLVLILGQFTNVFGQTKFEMKGAIVPRTQTFENRIMQLNGLGVRSKLLVDVYVQSLYLPEVSQNAEEIINSESEMVVRIEIISAMVTSGKLIRKMNDGFDNSMGIDRPKFQPRIDLFQTFLTEKIVEKDVFVFFYNPADTSIWVYKNEVLKGKIPGLDFKKAFLRIWLSEKPVDDDLKNDLLGK